MIRRCSLALLTLVASVWAGSLVVFGLLLVSQGVSQWISTTTGLEAGVWRWLGVGLIMGGQFVFMFMVADRVFPRAGRRLAIWCLELTVVLVGGVACAGAIAQAVL